MPIAQETRMFFKETLLFTEIDQIIDFPQLV